MKAEAARPEVVHFYIGDAQVGQFGPRLTACAVDDGEGAQLAGLEELAVKEAKAATSCRTGGSLARGKGPRWADLAEEADDADTEDEAGTQTGGESAARGGDPGCAINYTAAMGDSYSASIDERGVSGAPSGRDVVAEHEAEGPLATGAAAADVAQFGAEPLAEGATRRESKAQTVGSCRQHEPNVKAVDSQSGLCARASPGAGEAGDCGGSQIQEVGNFAGVAGKDVRGSAAPPGRVEGAAHSAEDPLAAGAAAADVALLGAEVPLAGGAARGESKAQTVGSGSLEANVKAVDSHLGLCERASLDAGEAGDSSGTQCRVGWGDPLLARLA